ncbi:MAG: hypothetical protein ACERKN_03285 [Velocimicrobium sp.]
MRIGYAFLIGFFLLTLSESLIGQKLHSLEQEENEQIYFNQRHLNKRVIFCVYEFFATFIFTKYYIHKVKRRMDVYSPGDEKAAKERTIIIFLATLGVALILISGIFIIRPKWIIVLVFLSGIYFFNIGMMNYVVEKEEMELLKHLLYFLSDIRHAYHETGMIEESIAASIHDKTPEEMRLHGTYLLKVLSSEDTEEEIKNYLDHVSNVYLKELLTLCVTVLRFGDQKIQGQSLFLNSIQSLKQSVNTEILRKKKQKHLFGGYSFILSAPLFSLPFISMWAVDTMPVLKRYYEGTFGILFPIAAFLVTWILYQLNIRLQESYFYQEREHTLLFYLCKIDAIDTILQSILSRNEGYALRLKTLILEAGDMISIREVIVKRILLSIVSFFVSILVWIQLPGVFLFRYVLFSIIIALISSFYPICMLQYEKLLMKHARIDEVMVFQSIIYMLSPIPQMTAELILGWLEQFAKIFRPSISSCIDCLSASEEEAFHRLYEEEPYEPFQRLIENLQACDKIGVLAAFDELGAERIYFQEERRQQGEMTLENKAAVGTFIAMIPTLFIVIGYLFLPFILESFSLFTMQLKQINF